MNLRVLIVAFVFLPALVQAQYQEIVDPKAKLNIESILPENYVRLPRVSPDGQHMLYVKETEGASALMYSPVLDTQKAINLLDATGECFQQIFWIDNASFVFEADLSDDGSYEVYRGDVKEPQMPKLLSTDGLDARITEVKKSTPARVAFAQKNISTSFYDLYVYDETNQTTQVVIGNPGNLSNLTIDLITGKRVGISQFKGGMELLASNASGGSLEPGYTPQKGEQVIPLRFGPDESGLYALSNVNRNYFALVLLDPFSGKEIETVYENPQADVIDVEFSPTRGNPLWCSYFLNRNINYVGLNPGMKTLIERIGPLAQSSFILENCDDLELTFAIKKTSPFGMPSYAIVNLGNTSIADPFVVAEAKFGRELITKTLPFDFTASDGTEIKAVLNTPKKTNFSPLVIILGDSRSDLTDIQMEPLVQMLCARNKAVLRLSLPGSYGFGKSYLQSAAQLTPEFMEELLTSAQARIKKEMGIETQSTYLLVSGESIPVALKMLESGTKSFRSISILNCAESIDATYETSRNNQWTPFGQYLSAQKNNTEVKAEKKEIKTTGTVPVLLLGLYKDPSFIELTEQLTPKASASTTIPFYLKRTDKLQFIRTQLDFLDK